MNGKIYDSKYVADANDTGVNHSVIQYQEQKLDYSSQTGDNGVSNIALLLGLLSLMIVGITIGFRRLKA